MYRVTTDSESLFRNLKIYSDSSFNEYFNRINVIKIALVPYVPDIPAIIIELKNGKSAGSALAQIKEKQYDSILQLYRGDMLLVGINYDPDTKEHQCRIERFRY